MSDNTGPGPMIKVKQEIIDEYFTGLTNRDSDGDDFPSEVIIRESDDSKEDNDDDHDVDQIEMQHIYEQLERNRNRKLIVRLKQNQMTQKTQVIKAYMTQVWKLKIH